LVYIIQTKIYLKYIIQTNYKIIKCYVLSANCTVNIVYSKVFEVL